MIEYVNYITDTVFNADEVFLVHPNNRDFYEQCFGNNSKKKMNNHQDKVSKYDRLLL